MDQKPTMEEQQDELRQTLERLKRLGKSRIDSWERLKKHMGQPVSW